MVGGKSIVLKKLFLILFCFIVTLTIISPLNAYDHIGPPHQLIIYVKNIETQDYYLDLLVENCNDYNAFNTDFPDSYKDLELYKYKEDNWMASTMRDYPTGSSLNLKGFYDKEKGMMCHYFGAKSIPETFKIGIQEAGSNRLFVSNKIDCPYFSSSVILDMKNGTTQVQVIEKYSPIGLLLGLYYLLIQFLICMPLTVVIEFLLSFPFRIKPKYIVILANILTQIFLHSVLIALFFNGLYYVYDVVFYICELIIVLIEYFTYVIFTKLSAKRLILYVLLANSITLLIGEIRLLPQ